MILPLVAFGRSWAVAVVQALVLAFPLPLLVHRLTPHPLAVPLATLAAASLSSMPFRILATCQML